MLALLDDVGCPVLRCWLKIRVQTFDIDAETYDVEHS